MTTQADIITRLKAFALAHYNEGYDTFVECFEDSEWEEFLTVDCHGDEKAALAMMATLAEHYSEQQADAAFYRDQADSEYTTNVENHKADQDNIDDAEAAHEWECDMAALRYAENQGYSGYNETDYMYDERNF